MSNAPMAIPSPPPFGSLTAERRGTRDYSVARLIGQSHLPSPARRLADGEATLLAGRWVGHRPPRQCVGVPPAIRPLPGNAGTPPARPALCERANITVGRRGLLGTCS